MFENVDLKTELYHTREARSKSGEEKTLSEFKNLFKADWERENRISETLSRGAISSELPALNFGLKQEIFSLGDIKALCLKYRLRFLSTKHFKGDIPREALSAVKNTEAQLGEEIPAFMMVAPSTMFKLEDANKDPLLMAPLNDGRFLLIHKWGNDLAWYRRLLAWPTKTLINLMATIAIVSLLIAAITPLSLLSQSGHYFNFYRIAFFGWNMIFLSGLVSYFWFALNQKFSVNAWDSSTFN
jgi:hypothetical protein